jgi:hypothetical protein
MTHPGLPNDVPQPEATEPAAICPSADGAGDQFETTASAEVLAGLAQSLVGVSMFQGLSEMLTGAGLQSQQPTEASESSSAQPGKSTAELERLDELAEDMLSVMRRMRDLEEGQQRILSRLDQILEQQGSPGKNIAREVDTLRRDLLADRRHVATADLIGEVMPLIERMSNMRDNLDPGQDARMLAQLGGVIETLGGSLRRLGGQEFYVEAGTPFDSFQMTSTQAVDVTTSIVAATIEPGLKCGQLILRRAIVQLVHDASKLTSDRNEG